MKQANDVYKILEDVSSNNQSHPFVVVNSKTIRDKLNAIGYSATKDEVKAVIKYLEDEGHLTNFGSGHYRIE